MSIEKFNFEKSIAWPNGLRFELRFEGLISNQNIDKDKINQLLNNFVNRQRFQNEMVRDITFLRTILKDFEEKLLVVQYSNANIIEIVKYDDGILSLFECVMYTESYNQIHVTFNPGTTGLSFAYSDYDKNSILDYSNIIELIRLLTNAKAVHLDRISKSLIEIYKLFYHENPDFSLPNINVRIQTMMSILAQFGISLDIDYGFNLYGKVKMPISLTLEQIVNRLFPLGEITDVDDPIKLSREATKIIKIAGECVREVINDEYNKEAALITISKVIHAGRYNLSSSDDIKELCEFTDRTQNEVESSIRLVRRIENKLNQPNQ